MSADRKKIDFTFLRQKAIENFSILITLVAVMTAFLLLRKGTEWYVSTLLLISGLAMLVGGNFKQRAVYLITAGIFTCFERHFLSHYGTAFSEIGSQALITLHITDPDEIKAYFKIFYFSEYILPLLFIAGCVMEFRQKRPPVYELLPPVSKFVWHYPAIIISAITLAGTIAVELAPPVVDYLVTWGKQRDFYRQRNQFSFNAAPTAGKNLTTVLVIGESHRKDTLDRFVFGPDSYAPFLQQARQNGLVWEFDNVITHYQQTYFSVFTLLSRRGNAGHDLLWPEKGLFGLFREAGFSTTYLTYQKKHPEIIGYNFVVNEADTYINHRDTSGTKFDHGMLKPLAEILQNQTTGDKNKFIIVKMVGVHFHYVSRFPEDRTLFTPCYTKKDKKSDYSVEDKNKLLNTYYNAMAFNVEFLDKVARQVDELNGPAVMIFVSDHGIVNYDDNKNVFFGAAKSNFHIPCFIYGNKAYRAQLSGDKLRNIKRNRSLPITNSYLFDTVASLSGVDYPGKRPEMDLTSAEARPAVDRKVWVIKQKVDYEQLP